MISRGLRGCNSGTLRAILTKGHGIERAKERRERKRLEQHVQQLQKFEAIGRLAGGIAHDFNNTIGAVMGWAEMGRDETQPGSRLHDRFEKILDQAVWAGKLSSQLLTFARRQFLQPRGVNLNALIDEGMKLLHRVIGAHIEIRVLASPNLEITLADPTQVEQALMNLCLNARDAMPEGGLLTIETQNVEIGEEYCHHHPSGKPGRYVMLSVSDTGVGMDKETLADDYKGIRDSTSEMLLALGYDVLPAQDGKEAVELFKKNADRIDLVLLDAVLPSHTGPEAYSQISAIRPGTKVIFASGYTAENVYSSRRFRKAQRSCRSLSA